MARCFFYTYYKIHGALFFICVYSMISWRCAFFLYTQFQIIARCSSYYSFFTTRLLVSFHFCNQSIIFQSIILICVICLFQFNILIDFGKYFNSFFFKLLCNINFRLLILTQFLCTIIIFYNACNSSLHFNIAQKNV